MSNPYLSGLLAKSNFAQLAKSNQLMNLRTSKLFPVAQTIETTTGSFKHRDYGLKSALPIRRKRTRIVVDQVDTIENMVAYERAPGDYYRKLKFSELDIPLKVQNNRENRLKNPLFFGSTHDRITNEEQLFRTRNAEILNMTQEMLGSSKNKILEQLRDQRSNFMRFLAEHSPEKYISFRKGDLKRDKLDAEISEFLIMLNKEEAFAPSKQLSKAAQNDNSRPVMKATGGLTFKLAGKLRTTPNGVETQGAIVPARLLKPNGDSYEVAVGGFVARASPATVGKLLNRASADKVKHHTQQTVPVQITSANLNANGTVQLNVEAIEAKTIRNTKNGELHIPVRERRSIEVNGNTIMSLLSDYS